MGVYVLNDLLYKICEVYIDDMLILGSGDDNFISNVRTVFQRCREKNVTLNAKKLTIGKDKVQFVGHEIDSCGINMSQKRIEGTIAFAEPSTLKELQSFLGLVNYFKDHLRDHSLIARPLYQLVADTAKSKTKSLLWTSTTRTAFEKIKNLVNQCQKLYFIDYSLKIILYTDASDYAHGAYLCQERVHENGTTEEPIRFWGGHFMVPKLGGQLLKRKRMQFTGHFCGWMISLGEYHLPYAQTIETSCL